MYVDIRKTRRVKAMAAMTKRMQATIMGLCLAALVLAPYDASAAREIIYGGQYYPEEFVLQGMPQLWQKYGLQVNHILFSSGAENNQALISGACHINVGSDSKTVELFSALEGKVVIIGVVQRGNRYATIVRSNAPYKTWSDLKGKTVATRFGTGAEQVLRRYFEINGMSWKDYRWVNMKLEDMIGALQSGSIEAFTVWGASSGATATYHPCPSACTRHGSSPRRTGRRSCAFLPRISTRRT
jgi:ABC-type nitrate/sulfonate/bicarbonate transport system substrate-binding protein